jgi:hypothetical protein
LTAKKERKYQDREKKKKKSSEVYLTPKKEKNFKD